MAGPLPSTLCALPSLTSLSLSYNQFTGLLQCPFPALKYLDVTGNLFTAAIPPALCSNRGLISLRLDRNRLTGRLPMCTPALTSLTFLSVAFNILSFWIPEAICTSFPKLKMLDLSRNAFYGGVPACLGGMTTLSDLDLSTNFLAFNVRRGSKRGKNCFSSVDPTAIDANKAATQRSPAQCAAFCGLKKTPLPPASFFATACVPRNPEAVHASGEWDILASGFQRQLRPTCAVSRGTCGGGNCKAAGGSCRLRRTQCCCSRFKDAVYNGSAIVGCKSRLQIAEAMRDASL